MSSRKAKRPSSARRNIKYNTFSTSVSCCRLRHVQTILQQSSVDGILCIHGIDSRYNDGTRQLVDYLLFDFFEQRRDDFERAGFDEDTIDDVMILITTSSVHVYCNPLNYVYLLPYISHWPHLQIHCMRDADYEDEEAAEDFKIHTFIAITENCSRIGIPYSSTVKQVGFDMMLVEKWPLVQAFALESYGGGGFFTMKHEVVDVSEAVFTLYNTVDPVMVEVLTSRHLPLFERQWNAMLLSVDGKGIKEMKNVSEKMVCEALHSYFHHGRMAGDKRADRKNLRQPFVLFGENSSKSNIEKCSHGGQLTDELLKDSIHMVVQAVSPRGPISCARTYFFKQDYSPYLDSSQEDDVRLTDANLLSQLYMISIEAASLAMNAYSVSLSAKKACSEALALIQDRCSKKRLPLGKYLQNGSNIKIGLSGTENVGRSVNLEECNTSLLGKQVEVALYDVPSVEQTGVTLGSVMFSETFLNSAIPITQPNGASSVDADVIVLTENVPRCLTWAENIEAGQTQMKTKRDFGQCYVEGESAQIAACSQLVSSQQGQVYIYENGIVFVHCTHGKIVIPRTHFQTLEFYDGDSPSVIAMIVITYKLSLQCHLPVYLQTNSRRVIIALSPKSKAYKTFYSEVYPLWKDHGYKPTLEIIHNLPPELVNVHKPIQAKHEANPSSVFAATKSVLPSLNRFLVHFAAGSLPGIVVPGNELDHLLKRAPEAAVTDDKDKLVISILGGVPGSHVDSLVKVITSTSKDESKWVVIKASDGGSFSAEKLQASLLSTVKAHRKLKPGVSKKHMRALVVNEGFTSIIDIVRAVYSQSIADTSQMITIGAITYCIDPVNSFMSDRFSFPSLLDSCAQGWVNNIVFTSSLTPKNLDLADIQQLIRTVNSDVALMLANKGEVTRSPDIDLILSETAFSHADMVRARHLMCPGWHTETYTPEPLPLSLTEVCLTFKLPLEKAKLHSQLKGLKGTLQKYPFKGNVYHVRGKVRFTGSRGMMEFQFSTLSGSLTMTPADLQPAPPSSPRQTDADMCHLTFTGCGCDEATLKDWMRKCTKQKLEKKPHRTRESLTAEEVKAVQKKHHLDALPEGWFYNGSQYVSLDGDKTNTHPNSESFLLAHIESVNAEIDQYNATVDAQTFQDLFD